MANSKKTNFPDPISQIETMDRPWEQLEGEPDKAYSRFQAFLTVPPHLRDHETAAEVCEVSLSLIQSHSSQWKWERRAKAWDSYLQRKAEERAIDQRAERLEEHTNMIKAYQKYSMTLIKEYYRRIANTDILKDLSDKDLLKEIRQVGPLIKDLIQLERTMHDEANEIHQVNHNGAPIIIKPQVMDITGLDLPDIMDRGGEEAQ